MLLQLWVIWIDSVKVMLITWQHACLEACVIVAAVKKQLVEIDFFFVFFWVSSVPNQNSLFRKCKDFWTVARIDCWEMNWWAKKKKTACNKPSRCMKTRGFGDWGRSKIDGMRTSLRGKRKWAEQRTRWRCREMLFWEEASCFLSQ